MTDEGFLLKEKYNGEKTEGFFADLTRLESGEPLAYIIGHIPFLGTTIFLDSKSLIPRAETEFWVENVITEIKEKQLHEEIQVLDLCAGSGCIGVAVLKHLPSAHVDFAEIDTTHHETILKNVNENNISQKRIRVFAGDLFEKITDTYDYIFANPPYIDPLKKCRVQSSVQSHEPEHALYGGSDGLEYIRRILDESPRYLKTSGRLFIEHEPEQTEKIHHIAQNIGYSSIITLKDQYKIDRITHLQV